MTESVEAVVVGAGVVGLAIGRALAEAGRETLILEAADTIGSEISSRNSEVIHAGIYYPAGSLKARLCVAGRDRLYAYCRDHGVEHSRLGKLIVASNDDQRPALAALREKARANGVDDLVWLEGPQVRALEPDLNTVAGLLSPSTGIIDSHGLMLAYQGDAEAAGAMLAFRAPLARGRLENGGFRLAVSGDEPLALQCRYLVNAAGLEAQAVARSLAGFDPKQVPTRYLAKGNYFVLGPRAPFRHLIYPMPEAAGLGVHLTLDLAGRARFGPDVEWIESVDYRVDPARGDGFYDAIRRYWPGLPDGALAPGYSGIRPKLQGPGGAMEDFLVQGPTQHGVPRLVHLFGIESPGLTASLAIADLVVQELDR
jgi:L-2-hydroxyglutarate oxidase LhgO